MNHQHIMNQLRTDEGERLYVYKDTTGHLTVGIGHLITSNDHLQPGQNITKKQCEQYFLEDFTRACIECYTDIPYFAVLHPTIQEVLINMMFNLGKGKLLQFKKMFQALSEHNYTKMAAEMKDSLWYKQVGQRAERLVACVLSLEG